MGIDISGGMILGRGFDELNFPEGIEDKVEWLYDNDFEMYSPWYDSEEENWVVGFPVEDVLFSEEYMPEWLEDLQKKADKFYEVFEVTPMLIGMQDVT